MERNRRVAKAYARAPILTINGCDNGFDGYRIGLNGFDNPMRDPKTEDIKRNIGLGIKVKMDQDGNVLIKRVSKANVYVKNWDKESENMSSVSNDIIKSNGLLECQKSAKLFDMKKFQANVYRELKNAYPDRRKLEDQCISSVAFVKDANDVLDCGCHILIINILGLDLLKSKLPPIDNKRSNNLMSMFERSKSFADEDPYSAIPSQSGKSNKSDKSRPPRLPPRDVLNKKAPINLPKPDYECDTENEFSGPPKSDVNNRKFEDPYYCGFKARVPNFAKRSTTSQSQSNVSSTKPEPPILKKATSKGILVKPAYGRSVSIGFNERHPEVPHLTHSESDSFLSKINSSNSISSGYLSGSNNNSIRSDNNDIYGVNRKLISHNKYGFNLKPNQLSSVQMHQLFSPRAGGQPGYVVGEWE